MTQTVSDGLFLHQKFTSDSFQGPEEIFIDTMYCELTAFGLTKELISFNQCLFQDNLNITKGIALYLDTKNCAKTHKTKTMLHKCKYIFSTNINLNLDLKSAVRSL